jgi:DNA-directed RNA polymerase sigma subunit (sigma70/sigma32)
MEGGRLRTGTGRRSSYESGGQMRVNSGNHLDLWRCVPMSREDRRVEEAEFSQLLRSKLKAFEATLQDRDGELFRQRLLSDEPMTLSELAANFGVTRERTRQLSALSAVSS